MKYFFIAISLILLSFSSSATVYTTITAGNWNNNSTWDANGRPGTYFGSGDQVIVKHDVVLNQNVGFAGTLTINSSGSLIGLSRNLSLNNGASIIANGETGFNNLTLNSTSSGTFSEPLTVDNNLVVGTNSTLITNETLVVNNNFTNNGGNVTANETVSILGNLTNNNGSLTFFESTTIAGNFTNSNGSAEVTINDEFIVEGNFQNNSSAIFTVSSGAVLSIDGSMANNSGCELNNSGTINSNGDFDNNGGTVQNDGVHFVDGDFTQNGGTYTNDGIMIARDGFRVNGGGTVDGTGIIRANDIVNYGTITGSNDICGLDDATPTGTTGNSFGASTTDCTKSASASLPISLLYFKGYLDRENLIFEWKTLSELNNNYFEVQQSIDGENYKSILVEDGAGTSYEPKLYKKLVDSPSALESSYYRLKQTDFDGKFAYSKPIYIYNETKKTLDANLYPNPSNGESIYLKLNKTEVSDVFIKLYTIKGNIVLTKKIATTIQNESFEILNGKKLMKGVYFLTIYSNIETRKIQIIVK